MWISLSLYQIKAVCNNENQLNVRLGQKRIKEGKKDCMIRLEKNVVPTSSSQDRCRELKQLNDGNYCIVTASYCT